MITHDHKAANSTDKGKGTAPSRPGTDQDDACRCKSTSLMTPRQLLGLMWSDLAFWKKKKKE
jgi:hypothetical protein